MKLSPLAILALAGLLSSGEACPPSPPGDAFTCYRRGVRNIPRTRECCRKTQGEYYEFGGRCHYAPDYKELVSTDKIITAEECCDAKYPAFSGKNNATAKNVTAY